MVDILLCVFVGGIIMISIALVLVIVSILTSDAPLITTITLWGFIIFFALCGISAIAISAVLFFFPEIGEAISDAIAAVITFVAGLVGIGVVSRYRRRKRMQCEADPQCSL